MLEREQKEKISATSRRKVLKMKKLYQLERRHAMTKQEKIEKRKDTAAALTINELRKKHRLPEIPDGDVTLVPISGKENHEEK